MPCSVRAHLWVPVQVVSFTDAKLHRDYLYCKALAAFTKLGDSDVAVDAGSLVELTQLRIEQQFEGSGRSATPSARSSPCSTAAASATKWTRSAVADHRADQRTVRHQLRSRRSASSTPSPTSSCRPDIQQQAAANSPENFALVLAKEFEGASSIRWPRPRT